MTAVASNDGFDPACWQGTTVVVLGDVMLDRYVYGDVERISPEGPIPVLRFSRESWMLGGAGNVARNVATLGGRPILVGALGRDAEGDAAERLAAANAIDGCFLRIADHPTTIKTRFVSSGQQLLRLDIERPLGTDPAIGEALLDLLRARLAGAGALILSDYAKGVLTPATIAGAIALARSMGVLVVVDPKNDPAVYCGASVITPNALEARRATGHDAGDDAGAEAAARQFHAVSGVGSVVLTRGAQGMTIFDPAAEGADTTHIATTASDVFDVSGAGDTVVATMALGLAAGLGVAHAAVLANAAAGVAVAKLGTDAVLADELARAMLDRAVARDEHKVLTREALVAQVRRWQAKGRRVGFTNGCFDLIHPGHIATLTRARAACDRLVVALNTDESVRRLKGASRPIQAEAARAIVMASIGVVDAVTLFGEDTPLDLIEAVRPDVLIKGADYRMDQVVGGDFVRRHGGRVLLIPLEAGHSTTGMLAR